MYHQHLKYDVKVEKGTQGLERFQTFPTINDIVLANWGCCHLSNTNTHCPWTNCSPKSCWRCGQTCQRDLFIYLKKKPLVCMHQEENVVCKLTIDLLQRCNGELYAFDVVTSCNFWTFVSIMVRNVDPIVGPTIYIPISIWCMCSLSRDVCKQGNTASFERNATRLCRCLFVIHYVIFGRRSVCIVLKFITTHHKEHGLPWNYKTM